MLWTACKIFLTLTFLTGCIYPLLITVIANLIMPYQAKGSLIVINHQLKGSELIAQPFKEDRYFWPRPSAIDYNPLSSGGSNLGPSSQKLKELVEKRVEKLTANHQSSNIPPDLLYASGSGLDPHISVLAARFQIERIATSRHLNLQQTEALRLLIEKNISNQSGILGPRYLNVLQLNLLLDSQFPNGGQS